MRRDEFACAVFLMFCGLLVAGCAFYGYAPESWGRFAWGCVAGSLLARALWPRRTT